MIVCSPVIAQAQNERVRLSTVEDIAIAFYRTGGITPDFKRWIWDRAPFKLAPAALRPRIFKEEMLRIRTAHQTFNKKRDYLTVKLPVDLKPRKEDDKYYMGMTLKGLDQAHYMSYQFMKEQIAVFPYGLDLIMDSMITSSLYEQLGMLNQKKNVPFVIIAMEAKEADTSRPYQIDNLQQWIFRTKIQTMTLYTAAGDLLWEYTAPVKLSLL